MDHLKYNLLHKIVDQNIFLTILGSTSSGKTRLARQIKRFLQKAQIRDKVAIVSVDSRHIYRELSIATGKKDIPAFMTGFVSVTNREFSIAEYQLYGKELVKRLISLGYYLIFTVGTGFYFDALKYSTKFPPADRTLRKQIDGMDIDVVVANLDAVTKVRVDLSNPLRVRRAYEVLLLTGRSIYEFEQKRTADFRDFTVYLLPDKTAQRGRIGNRVESFFENGHFNLVDECIYLRENFDESLRAFSTIGYRETLAHLRGEYGLVECKEEIIKNTMEYSKRQNTWFRKYTGTLDDSCLLKIIEK